MTIALVDDPRHFDRLRLLLAALKILGKNTRGEVLRFVVATSWFLASRLDFPDVSVDMHRVWIDRKDPVALHVASLHELLETLVHLRGAERVFGRLESQLFHPAYPTPEYLLLDHSIFEREFWEYCGGNPQYLKLLGWVAHHEVCCAHADICQHTKYFLGQPVVRARADWESLKRRFHSKAARDASASLPLQP